MFTVWVRVAGNSLRCLRASERACSWLGVTLQELLDQPLERSCEEFAAAISPFVKELVGDPDSSAAHAMAQVKVNGKLAAPPTSSANDSYVPVELELLKLDDQVVITWSELGKAAPYQQLLDGFLNSTLDVLVASDRRGYFTTVSACFASALGYSESELLTRPFAEFIHPDDVERSMNAVATLRDGHDVVGFDNRYLCRDGGYRWFRWRARGRANDNSLLFGVARDVTEEKAAEAKQWRLLEALKRVSQGVVLTTATGAVEWCNEAFERMTGYTEQELLGLRLGQLLQGPETDCRETSRVRGCVKEGKAFQSELLNYAKDGRKYWVRIEAEPITDPDGTRHFLALETDITRERENLQRIYSSEERLRAAIDGAHDAAYWLRSLKDDDGEIVDFIFEDMNPAAETELATPRQELIGRTICEAFPINRTGGFFERYKRVADTGIKFEQEYEIEPPHTAPGYYHHYVIPLRDGVAIFNRNLTRQREQDKRQKRLEAELRQNQKMEALGRMAGGIVHDFNNALSAILTSAEVLKLDLEDRPATHEILDDITRTAQRSAGFIKQLLTFSRRSEATLKPMQLADVVQQAARMVQRMLPKTTTLTLDLDHSLTVSAHAEQIEQVVTNLITNAQHAIEGRAGSIRVRVGTTQDQLEGGPAVELSVEDDGEGMSPEVLERALEPFYTTKTARQGTGLGLSVVHGIVSAHGGVLHLQSEHGAGTRVRVVFPLCEVAPQSHQRAAEQRPTGGKGLVLIIDDEQTLRTQLAEGLKRYGFEALAVSSGSAALAIVRERQGELKAAFVDYNMPDDDGFTVATRLKQLAPDARICIITGGGVNFKTATPEAVSRVFIKPTRLSVLVSEIQSQAS